MKRNLLLQTDSYKLTHWRQYPPGLEHVYSYIESRGGMFPQTVFFGLQYYLKEYLQGPVFTPDDIREAAGFARAHLSGDYFNRAGWKELYAAHRGRLPVEIKAVPEGTVLPVSNVLLTIENTDPRFPWLTNYLETLILKVWYPITVATLSREIKRVMLAALERSGDPSLLPFKLHDFGYRGVSSEETAAIGGAAHLVNFQGTDTIAGIRFLQEYYGAPMAAFSIPAAEHSTMTAWGKEREEEAYAHLLEQFPTGWVSVVSDSYDVFRACAEIWGAKLRRQVLAREGTVVVRPDSGDPKRVLLQVFEILGERFGCEVNAKGYRVLHPKVRVIQGDGVNFWTIQDILTAITCAGWSADNLAFGMGGALLQQVNRDTQRFAFKCSCVTIRGQDHEVYKDPVTDQGKWSKRGRLALLRDGEDYETLATTRNRPHADDLLKTVFRDGQILIEYTLDQIRERAEASVNVAV